MSDGETARQFALYWAGEEVASRRIWAGHLRLVPYVLKHVLRRRLDDEDLLQQGFEWLLRAVEKYDPRHGVKFATYAGWWIRAAANRYRDQSSEAHHVGRELVRPDFVEFEAEVHAAEVPEVADPVALRTVRRALDRLPRYEREVLLERLATDGRTLDQVGAAHGRSRESVRKAELRAVEKLRADVGRAGRIAERRAGGAP